MGTDPSPPEATRENDDSGSIRGGVAALNIASHTPTEADDTDSLSSASTRTLVLCELPPLVPMAPMRPDLLHKEQFALVFGGVKTQSYSDPAAKGPGSHT